MSVKLQEITKHEANLNIVRKRFVELSNAG
jgi:hypothetical protein